MTLSQTPPSLICPEGLQPRPTPPRSQTNRAPLAATWVQRAAAAARTMHPQLKIGFTSLAPDRRPPTLFNQVYGKTLARVSFLRMVDTTIGSLPDRSASLDPCLSSVLCKTRAETETGVGPGPRGGSGSEWNLDPHTFHEPPHLVCLILADKLVASKIRMIIPQAQKIGFDGLEQTR